MRWIVAQIVILVCWRPESVPVAQRWNLKLRHQHAIAQISVCRFVKYAIPVLMALCAGCVRLPVVPEAADFQIEGKIGVVEGDRRHAGRFIWRQIGNQYDVILWGPLGQGSTRLSGNAEHVEMRVGGGASPLAGHPDTVMRQHLGWRLPLAMLPWWMSGAPIPGGSVTAPETDAEGRLIAFRQFGWQIRYDQFDDEGYPPQPRRIIAERPGYRISLVILRH